MGIGDWGLGIGDWGLGIGPLGSSARMTAGWLIRARATATLCFSPPLNPIPNPQSPFNYNIIIKNLKNYYKQILIY